MSKKKWYLIGTAAWLLFFTMTANCLAQVIGNGQVIKEERKLSGFKSISVGNAIHLQIRQGSDEKVTVETDENILPYLKTEVSGGELQIGLKGNVRNSTALNVYVTVQQLVELESSSAARVTSEGKIESSEFHLSSGSGSAVILELSCGNLKVDMSSGSALKLSGSVKTISVDGSSGSALAASDLLAEKGDAEASSGAAIILHITKELKARVSSGAVVTVSGNPKIRDTDSSSGGSVHFK
jgi:hypothetical protein